MRPIGYSPLRAGGNEGDNMSDVDDRTPVLEVRGITKSFPGGVIANEDIDLVLHEGEIHCLLGENGAGKSTLMNVVFGLYQPDRGSMPRS